MRITRGLKNLNIKSPTAVAVGIFDGVHRGHQKILRRLIERSKRLRKKSCVVTFEPHPLKVLRPRSAPPTLISTEHRMKLIAGFGAEEAVIINFTADFADMTPARFAENVLKKRLNAKEIIIGENFMLGRGRSGDVADLRRIGRRLGFDVRTVRPVVLDGRVISSTAIRNMIISGDLRGAARLLGREVSVLGTVVRGSRRGRAIGFPTANIDPHHEVVPPSGVYIVKAGINGRQFPGVLNIGFRPTFRPRRENGRVIEAHIFGLNKPLYGRDIEIKFLKKIRPERRFKNKETLIERIKKDIAAAKAYFVHFRRQSGWRQSGLDY